MDEDQLYKEYEKKVLDLISTSNYPNGHPFLDYPNTSNSQSVRMLIFIYTFTKDEKFLQIILISVMEKKMEALFFLDIYKELVNYLFYII